MLLPRQLPLVSRAVYTRELRTLPLLVVLAACMEPEIVGPLSMRLFDAGPMTIASLSAAPHIGFLATLATTAFLRGRDRPKVVSWLFGILAALTATLTLLPGNTLGLLLFVLGVIAGRILLASTTAARTDIWRTAYPINLRGRAIATFAVIGALVLTCFSLLLGWTMDLADANTDDSLNATQLARLIILAAAILGAVGAWQYRNIRWRHRAQIIRHERQEHTAGILNTTRSMLRVLRQDRTYRAYMTAQFVMGFPNLASVAPFVFMAQQLYHAQQTVVFLLTIAAHMLAMLATTPLWGLLLDRVGIIRFRVFHAWTFVVASSLTAAGILMENFWILLLARLAYGIGMAGGRIAWSIGHHEFAPKHRASLYMGVHLFLTGLRGLLAPFLGIFLFVPTLDVLGFSVPGLNLGGWTFALFATLSAAGALLFARLNHLVNTGHYDMPGDHRNHTNSE